MKENMRLSDKGDYIMFDFHMHSTVSFDGIDCARDMAEAAAKNGLREICFTDHLDYNTDPLTPQNLFTMEAYAKAYDGLEIPGLTIRRGVEFGLTEWNREQMAEFLSRRPFDFVIGSVHYIDGDDPYDAEYWQGKTVSEAFSRYLETTLRCVRAHRDFDVLGHLTYVCKSAHNPTHEPVLYSDYSDIADEIMRTLAENGKGMEINTSGVDKAGVFLPSADFLRRFKELGGEIVTVGSDAHDICRVGQYTEEALGMLKDIFGYVCTFESRKPIFHKL